MMVSFSNQELTKPLHIYFAGAFFVQPYFSVYEDVGNVELCINYTLRDDLPQTVNISIGFNYNSCKFNHVEIIC